jgi:hypothetical protein
VDIRRSSADSITISRYSSVASVEADGDTVVLPYLVPTRSSSQPNRLACDLVRVLLPFPTPAPFALLAAPRLRIRKSTSRLRRRRAHPRCHRISSPDWAAVAILPRRAGWGPSLPRCTTKVPPCPARYATRPAPLFAVRHVTCTPLGELQIRISALQVSPGDGRLVSSPATRS